ncbi:carbohydrate ABC transporter permease [Bacilliculturomica massiliensis]|uniref:carbohydrate ABC transporter permease n=1 Tax=Bacilliculturomica massiliensis TaxID=1917867 RepID=UPI001032514F|nr:sugar ABC transporter permease [Bacilliculturomica massiliensis]
MNRKHKYKWNGYLYILPMCLSVLFFWYGPVLLSAVFSLGSYSALKPFQFTGMGNYTALFSDKYFIRALSNTFIWVLGVVPAQTVLAFFSACWIAGKKSSFLASLVRKVMFIPSVASVTVIGIVCRLMLNSPQSPVNALLGIFGGSASNLLGSETTALPTLMLIEVLVNTGYYMIFFLTSLMEIPESYYEAARMDGAGAFRICTQIQIPLLKPVFIMIIFLGLIQGFRTFDLVYTTTGGGPGQASMTAVVYLYMQNFKFSQIGYAMAIGNILVVIVALLTFLQRRLLKNKENSLY